MCQQMKKILTLILFYIFILTGCSHPDHTELYQELKASDKLVFATMSITKTARLEDSEWYKVGKRIAAYSYDTYLQAYIDMSELQAEDIVFDEKNRTVRVTLPRMKVEPTGRDMQMRKVYENIGVFRSEITAKERAAMKEQANKSLKKELQEDGTFKRQLIDSARQKAREYFEELFEAEGYTATIEFANPDADYQILTPTRQ